MATHPVKRYEVLVTNKGGISPFLKRFALKRGIKDLLGKGRVPISVDYAQAINPATDFVIGRYFFETVFIGRKASLKGRNRHNLRKTHKSFIDDIKINGIKIPYEVR